MKKFKLGKMIVGMLLIGVMILLMGIPTPSFAEDIQTQRQGQLQGQSQSQTVVVNPPTIEELVKRGNDERAAIQPPTVIPPPAVIPPFVYFYGPGQEPQIQKMPHFAYLGTRPLRRDDKIVGAVRYKATGKDIFEKVLEYHEKTYLTKKWDPAKTRMLVVKTIKNRSFSTSGSVSSSFSDSTSENKALGTVSRNVTSSTYGSGSIAPSFSTSYQTESFDVWFFKIE